MDSICSIISVGIEDEAMASSPARMADLLPFIPPHSPRFDQVRRCIHRAGSRETMGRLVPNECEMLYCIRTTCHGQCITAPHTPANAPPSARRQQRRRVGRGGWRFPKAQKTASFRAACTYRNTVPEPDNRPSNRDSPGIASERSSLPPFRPAPHRNQGEAGD